MSAFEIFYEKFIDQKGYNLALTGLKNTVFIAVFALVIGFLIGSVIATIKITPSESLLIKVLKRVFDVYVAIFRGTPIVVQLLLLHFALFPAIGLNIDSVLEAGLIFGLNSSAYMAEILRSGIQSVDKGQMEAGRSLGFGFTATMVRIILPQAIKNILPTLGNEFIALVKETSVVSFIAVVDLTKSFKAVAESTYEYFIPYIMLALSYLVIVIIITYIIKLFERRLNRNAK